MIDTLLANRYRIQAKIGDGGMAVVYRALDVVLHRPVAIKCLRPQFAGDPEFLQRFMQEAQAAASLSHPNVVNIFDVGQAGDVHYIVLEYVQGRNLKEILREEGRLSPQRAAHIARAVARALEAAHRRQLVHRDIKPHNILITPEGRVKVTDFGIARAVSTATLTQTGTVIGSVHYFSPEQARGQAVGPASDLYALGVVLYEMLTGTVPFRGDSPIAVAIKHVQEEPVPPRRLVPSIPAWLEQVVLKALDKDPAQRYTSAEEMARDLSWRAESLPSLEDEDDAGAEPAEPRGFAAAHDEPTRRVPAVGAWGPQVPQVPEPDEGSGTDRESEDPQKADEDGGPPRRRRRGVVLALVLLVLLGAGAYAGTPYLLRLIFPPEVTVPDLIGLPYVEAGEVLAERGLLLVIEGERYDRLIAPGHVMRQTPEGGRTVRQGRTVHVTVSRGPEVGFVPDVTGRPLREARLVLTQEGYVLGEEISIFEPGAAVNAVVDQDPPPGMEAEKGTPVRLWVSRPEESAPAVAVPDVRGRTLDEAERQLASLGLVLGNAWPEVNPLIPPGRVIDQNPAPNSSVEQGTAVDVVYSGAQEPRESVTEDAPPRGVVAGDTAAAGAGPDGTAAAGTVPSGTASGAPTPDTTSDGAASMREPTGETAPSAPTSPGAVPPSAGAEWGDGTAAAGPAEGDDTGWQEALATLDQKRRTARVDIYVPPGPPQEVVILVIDDFGAREVHRETLPGGTHVRHFVEGRGDDARLQVYIGGMMEVDDLFPR